MSDSTYNKTQDVANNTFKQNSTMSLASDILIISVDNSPDLFPLNNVYTLNQTKVNAT